MNKFKINKLKLIQKYLNKNIILYNSISNINPFNALLHYSLSIILANLFILNLNATSFEEIQTSQTFLYYRPAYFNLPARHSLWSQIFYEKSYSCKGIFQFIPIYQETINNKNKHLSNYFLINCKPEIIISGDNSVNSQERDVRAEWLYLPSNFSSTLSLNPSQEQLAFMLNFNQDLKNWTDIEYFRQCWLDLSIPILSVKNKINPQIKINNNSGTAKELLYALENIPISAKIPSKTLENTEIAELKLTLGSRWFLENNFFLATYGSLIAPTSDKKDTQYLFNSIIGPNGHWAMAFGLRTEFPLFNNIDDNTVKSWVFLDIENQNFFTAKRYRTFDLKNKQWSRYLQYRKPNQVETITGTKILTLNTWVDPHNMLDLSTGMMFRYKNIETQIGYSLWVKQKETIRLVRPCCKTPDTKYDKGKPNRNIPRSGFTFENFGIAGSNPGTSSSNSTIDYQTEEDSSFIFLTEYDINLCSGAYQGGSTNRVHGFIGINTFDDLCNLSNYNNKFIFGALGAFYEWAHTNSSLTNWGIWIKAGTNF